MSLPADTLPACDHAVMVDVLDAVSSEAALARERFERLQGTMGELVAACPPEQRAKAMADAQLIDALAQHLEALSTFAGELARRAIGRRPVSKTAAGA